MNSSFYPSSLQLAIGDAVASNQQNLLVSACAGSGKTTTILYCLDRIPKTQSFIPPVTLFLAFNKSIAETLRSKCPSGVECSTFHSLGLRALKVSGLVTTKVKVDSRKVPRLVWDRMDRDDPDVQNVIKLVSLLKGQWVYSTGGVGGFTSEWDTRQIAKLATHYDLDFQDSESIRVAKEVLRVSSKDLSTIDFDDMLYLPVLLNAKFEPRDYVFVDEAQDTNDIQVEILARLAKPKQLFDTTDPFYFIERSPTRYVFVGDPHQAIYGFRGANSDAMSRIAQRFSCKTLPLDVSYRCPKAVVREAQRFLSTAL